MLSTEEVKVAKKAKAMEAKASQEGGGSQTSEKRKSLARED